MDFPSHLRYSREHEWVTIDGEPVTIGITAHAADALGDIVFVQLPATGDQVTAGEPCGELESTKSVSDLFAPVNGEVVEVNQEVVDNPALINQDPYDAGWLFKVRLSEAGELLSADEYAEMVGE